MQNRRSMTLHDERQARVPERFEVVRGEVVPLMPTGGLHGLVEGNVYDALSTLKQQGLGRPMVGDVGVVVERSPLTCRGADAVFLLNEQLPCETSREGYLLTPPALVVEVVSPNDRASEIEEKVQEYLAIGVRVVWIVHPTTRMIRVHLADGSERKLRGDDLLWAPGVADFSIPAAALFADVAAIRPASQPPEA